MRQSKSRISQHTWCFLIAACCFSFSYRQVEAQGLENYDPLRQIPWIKGCDWGDTLDGRAVSLVEEAITHFDNGSQTESRSAFMAALDSAANAFSLNRKLSDGACVAGAQVRVGFDDDARKTLRKVFLAARQHWRESEPRSLSAPTIYMLKLAYLQFEVGAQDDLQETLFFVESALSEAEPSMDTLYAYMIFAQTLLVVGQEQAAKAAFASAREFILNASGDIDESALGADSPNAGLMMSELAWHEAQVGLFDSALSDLTSAKALESYNDACIRDTLTLTEERVHAMRDGEYLSRVMKSQRMPMSCQR